MGSSRRVKEACRGGENTRGGEERKEEGEGRQEEGETENAKGEEEEEEEVQQEDGVGYWSYPTRREMEGADGGFY